MSLLEKQLLEILEHKGVEMEETKPAAPTSVSGDAYLKSMRKLISNWTRRKAVQPDEAEKLKTVLRFLATYPDYPMQDVPKKVIEAIRFTLDKASRADMGAGMVENAYDSETAMAILALGYTLGRCMADDRLFEYED